VEGMENLMEEILDRAHDLEFQLLTKGWMHVPENKIIFLPLLFP
jgi:hypothetical protein